MKLFLILFYRNIYSQISEGIWNLIYLYDLYMLRLSSFDFFLKFEFIEYVSDIS